MICDHVGGGRRVGSTLIVFRLIAPERRKKGEGESQWTEDSSSKLFAKKASIFYTARKSTIYPLTP